MNVYLHKNTVLRVLLQTLKNEHCGGGYMRKTRVNPAVGAAFG